LKDFLRVAVVLVGILAIATGLIVLGRVDNQARPSANYSGPSGVSAFASLLEQRGFKVRADRTLSPRVAEDELAILISLTATSDDYRSYARQDPKLREMERHIGSLLRDGRHILSTQVVRTFPSASQAAASQPVRRTTNTDSSLTLTFTLTSQPDFGYWEGQKVAWENISDVPVAWVYAEGRGVALALSDGIGLTNRFLDQHDNARLGVSLVESIAPAKKVVFLEAAHGDIYEPGLLESIGRWLKYGWTQLLLVLVVIAYSIGRRFGLPVYDRFVQRGQRELVDAIGFLFQRSRATHSAMETILRNADRDLRKSLKISYDAPKSKLEEQLPASVLHAITQAETVGKIEEAPASEVLSAAKRVEREVAEFIGSRTIVKPKSRRKAT